MCNEDSKRFCLFQYMGMALYESRDEMKKLLQSKLFASTNERLNGVIHLPEESKKKRNIYLCITG